MALMRSVVGQKVWVQRQPEKKTIDHVAKFDLELQNFNGESDRWGCGFIEIINSKVKN